MIQLHLHTDYSLRDGLVKIPELLDKVQSLNMNAVATTEHGTLASAFDLYLKAKEKGIKPIIGCEAYIVWNINKKAQGERKQHFTLIAKNPTGYKNLLKLINTACTEHFYYTSRIDFDLLEKYREGIIAMSACSFKSVLYLYEDKQNDWCLRIANKLKNMFGNDFYLEIMPHQLEFQKKHNLMLCQIAEKLKIPVVVTQDTHYLEPSDVEVHDVLMKMQGRQPYGVNSLFFPSESETVNQLKVHDYLSLYRRMVYKGIEESDRIAEKVSDYEIPVSQFTYPKFEITEDLIKEISS